MFFKDNLIHVLVVSVCFYTTTTFELNNWKETDRLLVWILRTPYWHFSTEEEQKGVRRHALPTRHRGDTSRVKFGFVLYGGASGLS